MIAGLATTSGCAKSSIDVGARELSDASTPVFIEPDADAAPLPQADTLMCISYECPAPYATCPDKPGLCNTNLKTDLNNCGACGKQCVVPVVPDGEMAPPGEFSCVDGECRLRCGGQIGDCNGQLEDGCESSLLDSPNCGSCGNVCKDGEICYKGACGCPPGYTQCGTACTQTNKDANNCGACGNACDLPEEDSSAWPCGPGVLPPFLGPVCGNSSCTLGCTKGHFDCNNDMCGDGCETDLARDPKNCGACGHACLPEQECVAGVCECEDPGLSHCPGANVCIDLMRDPQNCGTCGNVCPGHATNTFDRTLGHPICELGRCSYYCPPGRADCDGQIENGCEVNLMLDPRNCGGCGVECDLEKGQPCAEGRCLTKPCDLPDAGGVF
ncbi:hypothetical protein [Labilithrix luteola]|uniref:hypothetical protein n=1 Tax=Labilithrix luteola TaxID=1391654 RepID=UPI0011BABEF8|nr:hypothetical protein [Labilithrix luteola]